MAVESNTVDDGLSSRHGNVSPGKGAGLLGLD